MGGIEMTKGIYLDGCRGEHNSTFLHQATWTGLYIIKKQAAQIWIVGIIKFEFLNSLVAYSKGILLAFMAICTQWQI
jgi:hypothetical protein